MRCSSYLLSPQVVPFDCPCRHDCCPLRHGVGCADNAHCCPHDAPICDTDQGVCSSEDGSKTVEWTEKKPAAYEFTTADGQQIAEGDMSPAEMYKFYRGPLAQMTSHGEQQQNTPGASKKVEVV